MSYCTLHDLTRQLNKMSHLQACSLYQWLTYLRQMFIMPPYSPQGRH